MSVIACIIPYSNGSYDDGNVVRYYLWRVGVNGIEIQAGGGEDGWVDANNLIANDLTFKIFLFVEVEDAVGDDLYEYQGKKRGRFVWRSKFTNPAFRTKLLDKAQRVSVQMGKGVKKNNIGKGPEWGKPREKPE